MPTHPLSVQSNRKPSLELSHFSTMFQQWDLGSEEASPASRRGSQHFGSDYSSSSQTSVSNHDFDAPLGPPHTRQRTTQACDKCRDRKTKCSGDHPVCKRCTARGLICHYAGRERVRGPARARLRNAMSSSSLDLHFSGDSDGDAQMIKQEDPAQSLMYSLEYLSHQQSQYQHLAFPTQHPFPYSQPCSLGGSPARDFQLSRMSLPQISHRRVQSHSGLGAGEPYGHPRYHPSGSTVSRLGPASVIEFDMRMSNGGQMQDYREDGSEPPSATASIFSVGDISNSSESSESTFSEPLSRCASALDFRLMNQIPQYRHQRLSHSESDARKMVGYRAAFHSPASIVSGNEPSPGLGPAEISVPPINQKFGNPWADDQSVTVREVELVYPSPISPISLTSDAIDMMARAGFIAGISKLDGLGCSIVPV